MNACPDREAMLQAYVDNELDAANALAFEDHLKTCDRCAARVRLLRDLKARLAQADLNTSAPHALRQRIDNLIEADLTPQRPARRPARGGVVGWLSAGAMTAVAASLAFVQFASPSLADVRLTQRLADAGALVGIPVVDHIILGDGAYASLRMAGHFVKPVDPP